MVLLGPVSTSLSRIKSIMDKNRLFWGSRRGMLELDLILLSFVDKVYPVLAEEDQLRYQQLLKEEDQDLFAWFMRRTEPTDPDLLRIVSVVREHTGLLST